MENNANNNHPSHAGSRGTDTVILDIPDGGSVDDSSGSKGQDRPTVYDPTVKFISLSNSMNVRALGGLGLG